MPKKHISLSDNDKVHLEGLLHRGSLKARTHTRILGLQYLDSGKSYQTVSELLGVTYQTVSTWAKHYNSFGLSFLDEKPRSGRPSKFSALDKAKVTALACSESPSGRGQWSLRLLADKAVELALVEDISYSSVRHILKKRITTSS